MDSVSITRRERISMFINEYYHGVSGFYRVMRYIGGPLIFYLGVEMYSDSPLRYGVAYGGMMITYSIYYTFKPLWWILIKWNYYKPTQFQIETLPEWLKIKENGSESLAEYSKFEAIIKRKDYFSLKIQDGLKIYLPISKLSEETIRILTEKSNN